MTDEVNKLINQKRFLGAPFDNGAVNSVVDYAHASEDLIWHKEWAITLGVLNAKESK